MRRIFFKIIVVGMVLMIPMCQLVVNAEELKIVVEDYLSNDDKEEELPKRSIVQYSECVEGVLNLSTKQLSLFFFVGYQTANVSIYKDGELVISRIYNVAPEMTCTYNLSEYGSGNYQVEIVINEDKDVTGNFII